MPSGSTCFDVRFPDPAGAGGGSPASQQTGSGRLSGRRLEVCPELLGLGQPNRRSGAQLICITTVPAGRPMSWSACAVRTIGSGCAARIAGQGLPSWRGRRVRGSTCGLPEGGPGQGPMGRPTAISSPSAAMRPSALHPSLDPAGAGCGAPLLPDRCRGGRAWLCLRHYPHLGLAPGRDSPI